jgi:hypothetical protein
LAVQGIEHGGKSAEACPGDLAVAKPFRIRVDGWDVRWDGRIRFNMVAIDWITWG